MFSPRHILYLSLAAAVCAALTVLLRKKSLSFWINLLLGVGIVSETVKVFSYIIANEETLGGYLPKTDLPFHLCSIQLIFFAILKFSSNEKLKRLIMAFMIPSCLVGGAAALLIPTASSLAMPAISIQYFSYHAAIVAFAIHLMTSGRIDWTVKDYLHSLYMLGFLAFAAIYLNSICYELLSLSEAGAEFAGRVNFMYVVDPPVSGLPFLNEDHGWFVYIVHYAATAVTAVTLCYLPVLLKKKKKASGEE